MAVIDAKLDTGKDALYDILYGGRAVYMIYNMGAGTHIMIYNMKAGIYYMIYNMRGAGMY